ncbi:MAG: M28 family peptidase [Planctomycetes bacterium]|nr:M28 family peptidase [Planctomycetota bacterium]
MKSSILVLALALSCLGLRAQEPEKAPAMTRDDIRAAEGRLMTNIRQLTYEGLRAGEGYFSADGTRMIFQSERDEKNPFYQIYLMDLDTGDLRRLSPGFGKTTCAWIHPNGKLALYASTHEDPEALVKMKAELDFRASGQQRRYAWDYDETFDIYSHDLDSGEVINLTNVRGYDAEGSYSPDGKWIAFASNRHAYTEPLSVEDRQRFEVDRSLFMDIYLMKADGSEVRRLTTARGYDGGPFFSADSSKICWRRFTEDGVRAEVWTMNVDGSDQRQITRIGAMSWAPTFHPSGQYLIFATNKHGFANFELYLVDAQGHGEPVRVTWTDKFDGLPTFTSDGKKVSWTSQRTPNGQSQIFIADWNHEAALALLKEGRNGQKTAPTEDRGQAHAVESPALSPLEALGQAVAIETVPAITVDDLEAHIGLLASDATAGRFTGSEGELLASLYVSTRMKQLGLDVATELIRPAPAVPDTGHDAKGNTLTAADSPLVAHAPDSVAIDHVLAFDWSIAGGHGSQAMKGVGHNVVGILRSDAKEKLPAIVIGAHMDHLGTGGVGAAYSRSTGEDQLKTHYGADDNASGVSALLEVAQYLVDLKKKGKLDVDRDIWFCAWSGEELGLLGSNDLVKEVWEKAGKPDDLRGVFAAYLNMDMVGRLESKVIMQGIGSSSIWRREIERRNAPIGLPMSLSDDVHLPTDTMSFYLRGVPILAAFTGAHGDYHRHTDTAEKLNYEGMRDIARFMGLMARGLAASDEAPDYIKVERKQTESASARQGIYLGTVPDYAEAPIPGLQLSGVSAGGPAEKAGLKGGDIIVELAGEKVTDIHSYMAAFGKLEIGKAAKVKVVRDKETIELEIVPGTR